MFVFFTVTQRVSQVLWSQLDTERKEQHISCVDLFYRLHCLTPSASICEDIICQALLHKDKVFFHYFLNVYFNLGQINRPYRVGNVIR